MDYLATVYFSYVYTPFLFHYVNSIIKGTQVHPTTAATFGHPFEILTKERSHLLVSFSLTLCIMILS